jgi:hypothetical protein
MRANADSEPSPAGRRRIGKLLYERQNADRLPFQPLLEFDDFKIQAVESLLDRPPTAIGIFSNGPNNVGRDDTRLRHGRVPVSSPRRLQGEKHKSNRQRKHKFVHGASSKSGPRSIGLIDAKDDRIVKHVERSFSDKSPKPSDLASHSSSAIGQICRPSSSYDEQKGSIVATAQPRAG